MQLKKIISLISQSMRGEETDYTSGSMRRAIILLAIPMILELSLESIFAVVDMFFVGKLGSSAIATVALTEAVITLIYSVAIGLSTAATAMVARRVGEKHIDGANHAGMQAILICIILALIISVFGIVFAKQILTIMGAQQDVIVHGYRFTQIMFMGSTSIILLFLINGIFRGAGDAVIAMRSLWIASGVNIVLCPILIYGLGSFNGFGLIGAAMATTIGRTSGVLYQMIHLIRGKGIIKLVAEKLKPDFEVIKGLIQLAWPATFQFIIQSGSWIILARLVAQTGGTDASAGYQIAIRNIIFFILPAWGLSNAAATLVGQNLGANQPDRAEQSVLMTSRYNAYFMAFVTLLFVVFPSPIIHIFSDHPIVVDTGVHALRIVGAGYIFYGIGMVMMNAFNGAGDTKTPTWVNFLGFWCFQVPLAYVLVNLFHMGVIGVFIAIPAAEVGIALALYILFKKGSWKKVKV